MRYSLNLFHFNRSNLLQAKKISAEIEDDLKAGSFDCSLNRYKPPSRQEAPISQTSLIEHFEFWVKNLRNMDCERDIDCFSTRNMMLKWGTFDASGVLNHFNKENFSAKHII